MQKKCENILKMKGEQNEKDFAVCHSNFNDCPWCN